MWGFRKLARTEPATVRAGAVDRRGGYLRRSSTFEKLEKLGTFKAQSTDGYTVELRRPWGAVVYQDGKGEVAIAHSWIVRGLLLHPGTLRAKGLDEDRVELITSRAMRALQFLGHYVEAS